MNRRQIFQALGFSLPALFSSAAMAQGNQADSHDSLAVRLFPGMGRGVATTRPIKKGAVVIRNHTLELEPDEMPAISETGIDGYILSDDHSKETSYLALGLGSLLNHSFLAPNLEHDWVKTPEGTIVSFTAIKDINPGEQLFFDYAFDADDLPDWADNPR